LRSETAVRGEHTGRFMITLCRLTKAVVIHPPRAPELGPFTFFMSRLRRRDGSERLYLHMGYFATLSDAQKWLQRMRTRYPNAIATPAPLASLQQPSSGVPTLQAAETLTTSIADQDFSPVKDEPLSDTQVMRILETRTVGTPENGTGERNVELLRPDDTYTRRVIKQAVVEGAPVPFAVQLEWSVQPIDASRVPQLDIFKGYTLYRTEKRRGGRSCYFLRLGFFTDAISAKEVACHVRSTFASVAVVPVTEQEFLHADEARIDTPAPASPLQQGIDEALKSDRTGLNAASGHLAGMGLAPAPSLQTASSSARAESTEKSKIPSKGSSGTSQETLAQALESLADREMWTHSASTSDTGVRHLAVAVKERTARRS
jgi:hypothetical protein